MRTDDMSELFCTYRRTGDKAVRNEIVMQSMHIVRYAVISTRNMFLRFTDEDDISNEAVLALISARKSSLGSTEPGSSCRTMFFSLPSTPSTKKHGQRAQRGAPLCKGI